MADECLFDGICDSLEDIGYSGPLLEEEGLREAVEGGLASPAFIELCLSLCSELKQLLKLQESVSRPQGPADAESFQLEVRGFLKELHCPHPQLLQTAGQLSCYSNKLMLIDFLLSELLTARLLAVKKTTQATDTDKSQPYSVAGNLAAILKVYGVSAPPDHISVLQIFDRIIQKTKDAVASAPKGYISPGLVTQPLTVEQWATLDRINETLTKEYSTRRKMLLTRFDVTVQSFRWSEKAKSKGAEFSEVYQSQRQKLIETAPVSVAQVLAAKQELLTVQKASSGTERESTQCSINKVLIGRVPDRGGRPRETRPPVEMPSFKQRTEAPREKREGRHKGGGGKGGRVQGGWSGKGKGGGGGGGGWHQGGKGGGGHRHHGNKQQYYYS